jgi:hypothetical protein
VLIVFILSSLTTIALGATVAIIVAAVLQKGQYSIETDSFVNFIVAPDIKQDDLLFRNYDGYSDPIAVGNADCLDSGLLAAEMVIVEMGLKRVFFQIAQDKGDFLLQLRMALYKLPGSAGKMGGPYEGVHASVFQP